MCHVSTARFLRSSLTAISHRRDCRRHDRLPMTRRTESDCRGRSTKSPRWSSPAVADLAFSRESKYAELAGRNRRRRGANQARFFGLAPDGVSVLRTRHAVGAFVGDGAKLVSRGAAPDFVIRTVGVAPMRDRVFLGEARYPASTRSRRIRPGARSGSKPDRRMPVIGRTCGSAATARAAPVSPSPGPRSAIWIHRASRQPGGQDGFGYISGSCGHIKVPESAPS